MAPLAERDPHSYGDTPAVVTSPDLARTMYAKARAGYHPIAVATIDAIVRARAAPLPLSMQEGLYS
jgi:hypothetical protein